MKNKNPKERNSKVEIELDEDEVYVPDDWYEEEEEDVFEMLSYEERIKFLYSNSDESEEHKESESHENKADDVTIDEDEMYAPAYWNEEEEDVFEMLSYEERLKFIYSEPNELEEHKEYETHRNNEDDNLPI